MTRFAGKYISLLSNTVTVLKSASEKLSYKKKSRLIRLFMDASRVDSSFCSATFECSPIF